MSTDSPILLAVNVIGGLVLAFSSGYVVGVDNPDQQRLDEDAATVDCHIWSENGSANAICFATNGVTVRINNESHRYTESGTINLTDLPTDTERETE